MSVYVSSLLTATAATVNADPASTRTWQWQRNGVDIPGATNSTYSAAPADIGSNLFVVQTETNFLGTNNASASVGPVVAFSPIALFQDGSQGWWYDDDDLTTLFQDSAGTTPVTAVEQFVGLQLDKSRGLVLGPELVTNGTFDSNVNGWVLRAGSDPTTGGSITWVNGVAQFARGTTFPSHAASQLISNLVVGRWYVISGLVRVSSGSAIASIQLRTSDGGGGSTLVNLATTSTDFVSVQTYWNATQTSAYLSLAVSVDSTAAQFDNVSVRELPGNHRYAPASGNRPIFSKRVNLLTKTEQFDDAVWNKGDASVTANATIAPNGTDTADTLVENGSTGRHFVYRLFNTVSGTTYTLSIQVKNLSRRYVALGLKDLASSPRYSAVFDLVNGVATTSTSSGSPSNTSSSIVSLGNGWFQLAITMQAVSTQTFIEFGLSNSATPSYSEGMPIYTGDGTSGVFIWGADLRPANQATGLLPLYQRVNTSTDYDTNGFPGYLKADGVDDFLQTNTINFGDGPTNPPLGPELVVNGDGTTLTGWTSVNDASCTTAVSGGQFVLTTVAGGGARLRQTIPVTAGRAYRITGFVQANNNSAAGALQVWGTGYGSGDLYASAQVVNGTVSATVTATSANLYLQLNAFNSSSGITNYYDNISVKEITNANLGADKITLCAGLRKLSDAASGSVVDLNGTLGTNSFMMRAPEGAAANYWFYSGGSAFGGAVTSPASYAAPTTNVVTGFGNISGDSSVIRVNGAQVANSTGDQGTGNYSNLPVYFFRRQGSAIPFNGNEYGNIAVGKLLTADQLTALETYMNGLTKAY